MARPEKVAVVEEVKDRFTAATATVLTEYRGLTVTELADLRAELRKNAADYKVAKNTLVRIAAREAGLDLPDALLTGPTAITFCAGDPVAVAKVLRAFSREHPALVVKGGILEGKLLDAGDTLELADLETREELLSRFAGMMQTIVAQPARLAHASLTKAARLLAAYQSKREEAGEEAPEVPAAAAEEPSPPAREQAGVAGETPEPDSPAAEAAAEAVTEEAAEAAADATAGDGQGEEPEAGLEALPETDTAPPKEVPAASKPDASTTEEDAAETQDEK